MKAPPVGSRGLGKARGFEQAEHGLYETEAPVGRALCDLDEPFVGPLWECACGLGALSRILAGYGGHRVVSTDLVSRGFGRGGVDFLKTKTLRAPNIVTNPPFYAWRAFAEHAVDLGARKIALVGRLLALEDFDGRADLFRRTRGWRVWSVGRSKMLPVGAVDRGDGGMIAFAWFVRDAARTNEYPEVRWHRQRRGKNE